MADIEIPNAVEIEKVILGYVMTSGRLDADLEDKDFYSEANRIIWKTLIKIVESERQPDLLSVMEELRAAGQLDKVGGPLYLTGLTDSVPHFKEVLSPQYIAILREKYGLRVGLQVAQELMVRCAAQDEKFSDIVGDAFSEMDSALARLDRKLGPRPISDIVQETYNELERVEEKKAADGFKTGFGGIDALIPTGINRKNLAIVAGRPGHGKTSLLLGMATRSAAAGVSHVIFSLEMSEKELVNRMLSSMAEVKLSRMVTGFMSREDWVRLGNAASKLSTYPIWIDDSATVTVADMRSRIRRLNREINVIMVDYLQLVYPPHHLLKAPDVEKVSSISMALKSMAKSMNAAVISAAQLSRASEKRRDKRPQLSDLRQSGQIEQDADVVLMLYREQMDAAIDEVLPAEVILAKQRNGPQGTIEMGFEPAYSRFKDQRPEQPSDDRWYDK
jgi:replicative DNA helicase